MRLKDQGVGVIRPLFCGRFTLIAPSDDRDIVEVGGDNWWIELGPVNLAGPIIAIQRGNELITAIAARPDGRLRAAAYHPLDAKSAGYLIAFGLNPHPEWGVSMRENNWEYALDSASGAGNFYAAERGEAYLAYSAEGVGTGQVCAMGGDGSIDQPIKPRRPATVATELGVFYTMSDD